ncbi:hypothetical protein QYM36_014316 [Artemia franciscana]|uniref:Uncharacterized protein n=1 Tax=Artemia franciscana TaxID=6661 RepID=A0AA88L078_ARTSF|nr:hypothetical protein QYM36_014316 [Artemia franciscana]
MLPQRDQSYSAVLVCQCCKMKLDVGITQPRRYYEDRKNTGKNGAALQAAFRIEEASGRTNQGVTAKKGVELIADFCHRGRRWDPNWLGIISPQSHDRPK